MDSDEMLSFKGSHAAGTSCSDGLTVFLVLDVAGSEDTGNVCDGGSWDSNNVALIDRR